MSNFCSDQGRTRVFGEAYVCTPQPEARGTQSRTKRAIYGWTLVMDETHNPSADCNLSYHLICSKHLEITSWND